MAWQSVRKLLPATGWLSSYTREEFASDSLAGTIVAIMLIPQGMAYALLAGLPPEVGLYASIAPLIAYALLGSSRTLAVGPVAIVSLMTASALGGLATSRPDDLIAGALILALLSGAILIAMGIARLGVLVNFLSHPVISGFTSAAALVIGFSQLKHLLGIDIPQSHLITDTMGNVFSQISDINSITVFIGVGTVLFLAIWRGSLERQLKKLTPLGLPGGVVGPISKAGALVAVTVATFGVWIFRLDESAGVAIVGTIPSGLPPLTVPRFDPELWQELLPAAALISFVGFLESISVAKSLAAKRRQKVHADQELIALGTANVSAAFTGGYAVTGGFSRSMVNFTSGAATPLASIITATLVAVTVIFFSPLFHFLPKAVLASIIIVAVASLVDLKAFINAWNYSKTDAISLAATFVAVLATGVEFGIIFGATISIGLYLWRTSRPHTAIVGRVGQTEHFRNVNRHKVSTYPNILTVRIDESLYFANTAYLEDVLLDTIIDHAAIRHLILICSAVNFIDTSALESLERLIDRLRDAGVTFHLAEVKGPVMDKLEHTDFLNHLKPGQVFLSTHQAVEDLRGEEGQPLCLDPQARR